MLVFLMRDLKVDLLYPDKDPVVSQSIVYRDPNRSFPSGEGEELNQVLHELYQRFHAHALKLAKSGYLSFIFDNVRSLHYGGKDPTLIAFTHPQTFDPPRVEMHIQTFFALDIDEPFLDRYKLKDVPFPHEGREWQWAAEMAKKANLLDQLLDERIEVTSPWKEAQFGMVSNRKRPDRWSQPKSKGESDDEA